MSQLTLSLLGSLCIEIDGVSVNIATHKAKALLIYLAVTHQPHRRDTLAALLWPEFDDARAKASLRRALADVKKAIGGNWLYADRQIVSLNTQTNIQVDALTFRSLLNSPPEQADLTTLTQAIDLYRADFLTGFTLRDSPAFDEWQFFEQEDLSQALARALVTVVSLYQERDKFSEAIPYGRRYVALDPLHEPAHRQLMQLYAQNRQLAAALRQFETCQRLLAEELGVEPDPATTDLYHQIKSRRSTAVSLLPLSFPEDERATQRHNLPPDTTSFVGRDEELGQLTALLDNVQVRLLTLVGLGGIGKTRLALQAATHQLAHFPDGVWYVDLVPFERIEEMITAVAALLDLTFSGIDPPHQQLGAYIQEKKMLWLLDNCEHLLDSVTLISDLLRQVPGLKIMVTSREMLDLAEEWLYQVDGLPFPQDVPTATSPEHLRLSSATGKRFSAVQLFSQRARQAQHDFSLPTEETHVIHICQLVEGMPLALELAAAWVRLLPCQQIASEIQQSLDFLATTQRNVSDRHRSVRAVFEYSWQMLSPTEQKVLAQLSVFRGRFTAEAAQAVADASLFTLYSLLNKSLVRRNGQNHYELHELLRQFAAQKLANREPEPEQVPERHMAYYTNFLHNHEEALFGAEQTAAIIVIGQEIENVYQAWLWAAANGRIASLNNAFHSLYNYHAMRSLYHQGQRVLGQTIDLLQPYLEVHTGDATALLTRLLARQGEYQYTLGHMSRAEESLRQALSLAEQMHMEDETLLATQTLGIVSYLQGRYAEAKQLLTQALETAVAQDNIHRQALTSMTLGAIEQALGNYTLAQERHQASLEQYQELDYQWGIAYTFRFLGMTAYHRGDYAQALVYSEQSLEIFQAIDNKTGMALALNNLGLVAQAMDRPTAAHHYYQQSLASGRESRTYLAQAVALQSLGRVTPLLDKPHDRDTYLHQALELALKTEATPLVLDILLDIAQQLEAGGQQERAVTIAGFIQQHPASSWATQTRAKTLQTQLTTPSVPQIETGQIMSTLQQIVTELIHPP